MRTKIPTLTYTVQIVPWAPKHTLFRPSLCSELLCTKNLRTVTKKAQTFFVTASTYSLETPHFHRKPNQPSINCSFDPFSLAPPLSAVPLLIQTNSTPSLPQQELRVTGNCPSGTLISPLHDTLNIEPIQNFIHGLTAKCFATCPSHPNPLV
jgi:hypothetical protein